MAIIVEHSETQTLYVVVGTGYALGSRSREDAYPLVACADAEGAIRWFYSSQLTVELVDGHPPGEALEEAEALVYERTSAAARPGIAAAASAPEVDTVRARAEEARAELEAARKRVERAKAEATAPPEAATPRVEVSEPPVDPKEVVGTSADLWADPNPL